MPSDAISQAAASEPFAPSMARPHGSTAGQVEALPGQHCRPMRLTHFSAVRDVDALEAALRAQLLRDELGGIHVSRPLSRGERIGFIVCLIVCGLIGWLLAIGRVSLLSN